MDTGDGRGGEDGGRGMRTGGVHVGELYTELFITTNRISYTFLKISMSTQVKQNFLTMFDDRDFI